MRHLLKPRRVSYKKWQSTALHSGQGIQGIYYLRKLQRLLETWPNQVRLFFGEEGKNISPLPHILLVRLKNDGLNKILAWFIIVIVYYSCLSKFYFPFFKTFSPVCVCVCVCVCVLSQFSRVQLFVTPRTVAHQAPLSMGFSRREHWGGQPCPSPGDLPNSEIEPMSLMSPALADGFFPTSTTWEALLTL